MCNNTLPEFKLEDNLKLINVAHAEQEESERGRLMMTRDKSFTGIVERDVTGLVCQ